MHSLKLNTNVARTINLYEKMSKKKDELLINKFTLLHSTCFVVISKLQNSSTFYSNVHAKN